jgi:hypothetical protein
MSNRKEYKVVVFNQEVQYIAYNSKNAKSKGTFAFSAQPHTELIAFVHQVVQDLKLSCPSFIYDGLVRVDVFQNQYGEMVVNELESLEADYHASNNNRGNVAQHAVTEKLTNYWSEQIEYYTNVVEVVYKKNNN